MRRPERGGRRLKNNFPSSIKTPFVNYPLWPGISLYKSVIIMKSIFLETGNQFTYIIRDLWPATRGLDPPPYVTFLTEGSLWTLRKFVLTSGSRIYVWQVSKDNGDFFPLLSLLSLCCSIKQITKICFSVFLAIMIIHVIFLLFILLNHWNLTDNISGYRQVRWIISRYVFL